MNSSQHVSSQFDQELEHLRTTVLQMGGIVESQVAGAMEAYVSGDISNVSALVAADREVNELEVRIDDQCAHIIARRQPTASDLRLVLGISKIVTDLERSGDEAKKIAKAVRRICEAGSQPMQLVSGVRHTGDAVLDMLRQALDVFARLDASQARAVIVADEAVDRDFKASARALITYMMEDPRTITTAMEILNIARSIERIGDHAKNVAEHIVFIIEGRDIRHPGKQGDE